MAELYETIESVCREMRLSANDLTASQRRMVAEIAQARDRETRLASYATKRSEVPAFFEHKVKRLKRWWCRGAVCSGHTVHEARRIFKQSFSDVRLDEIVRISRKKDHP